VYKRQLADLAKLPVPSEVKVAYNDDSLVFGKEYIIPKPVDPRLLKCVAPAVAKAAMKTGVAKYPIENWDAYEEELENRLKK
jgi:malate dehydrogenase (oxaloacetate-decarboxylating)(NADP+)